ncbi:MAG: AsmA family protein [Alphaproteobacteria bacterium]
MPTPEMLSLGSLRAKIALWPLISREVVIESLVIEELSLFLEVAEDGRRNWVFEAAAEEAEGGLPEINDLRLGDVRLERGLVSYIDSRSGQAVQARDIDVTVALADIASALTVKVRATVNDEPVIADLSVDSPAKVLAHERFAVTAALRSERLSAGLEGVVQQAPVPGFDGALSLDIDSVGELMAWLEQPLDPSQPDPGRLRVRARLAAEGARVALEEATIEGEALEARAHGSFDGSGEIAVVTLAIESGVLDIDRYLPPPTAGPAAAPAEADNGPAANPLAALSDQPLDLSPLRQTKADVKINIGGVKAAGFEIGRVALTLALDGGVLEADLVELGLYGGKVSGSVHLDGSGEALDAAVDLSVKAVDVGRLARAAGGEEAPVAGVASGTLKVAATGASPRALAEAMTARLVFDLGGIDIKDAPAGALSGLAVDLDLPGLDTPMTLKGSVVYNKEKVDLDLTLDPLKQVLWADRFGVAASVRSRLLSAAYKGDVLRRPAPGLDGALDLEVASVGRLAAWLGQPLDAQQPDPGPLTVRARFAAEGARVMLEEATIAGTALEIQASGSFEKGDEVDKVVLNLRTGVLDIDRYLPPPAPLETAPAEPEAGPAADLLAALSDQPLELGALRRTEAEVRAGIAGLKVMGYELGELQFAARLKGGKLAAELTKLVLYGGTVAGKVRLDATGEALDAALDLELKGVDVGALARAAMGDEAPLAGVASGTLSATTSGSSPRALAEGLKGKLAFELGAQVFHDDVDYPLGAISELAVALDFPGLEAPPSLKGSLTYNQERVALELTLDPLEKVLGGERFALKAALASKLINAAYDGSVQQRPALGLDGALSLDVASVGRQAAWLGQPLDAGQPDPGPLKVRARFAAEGAKATLEQATIVGKAVRASLQGSFDSRPEVPVVVATINIQELDLDAYLPPPAKGPAGQPGAAPSAGGWSTEPIDLAPLRQVNADLRIETGPVTYRGLVIERSRITALLKDAVLTATVEELVLAGGRVGAALTLDGSGGGAALSYQVKVDGVQAEPVLKAFADNDRLSGTMQFATRGQARGRNQLELVSSLNGDGSLKFFDGAIAGLNLAAALRKARTLGFDEAAGQRQKTDFAELGGTFTITGGVIDNRDFRMLAPLVRVVGAGLVPMPPRTIDYRVEAKLVASLAGQGGKDALAGLSIPIHVTGTWDHPSYNVDWASVFTQAALDPERLANMPSDLMDMAEGLGIPLKLPTLPSGETGGVGGALGAAIGGALGVLPGVSSGEQATAPAPAPAPAPEGSSGGLLGTLELILKPKEPQKEPAPWTIFKGLFGGD